MLTVGEAKMAARAWVREEAAGIPGFVGAYLAGSILTKSDADTFPETSDVDLSIVVDSAVPNPIIEPANSFSPRKLLYRGLILEPSYLSWEAVKDPEAVLSNMYLAAPFAGACILSDPRGEIDRIHRAVEPEFARRRWIRKRCAHAAEAAFWHCDLSAAAPPLPVYDPLFFKITALLLGALTASCIPVLAGLGNLTMRRGFIVARSMLLNYGMDDPAEGLLRIIGSTNVSRAEAERCLEELEVTFDAAVALPHPTFAMDCNVSAKGRRLAIDGCRELLDDHHREAMFYIAFMRGIVQNILLHDEDPARSERFFRGYWSLLRSLEIRSFEDATNRAGELRSAVPVLLAAAEEILERNPEAID
jgi:hypothetical protein